MLETASRQIHEAAAEDERRRREAQRLPLLVAALDDVLFELEERNVLGDGVAPPACRRRAAELIAEASGLDAPPEVPATVPELMDRVYEAQELALILRRRAGWGLNELAGSRPG
ncbi:MAG TPA: hypothetical protein VOB72_23905 [Candidatus Dormibacteraeota bacterium]|nr:hypothetical protein [Candidatus Dormibacteraeota bacterium]